MKYLKNLAVRMQKNKKLQRANELVQRYGLLVALLTLVSGIAFAGNQGAEFDTIYQMVRGWLEGTLGKVLAMGAFGIGMAVGIVKQSLMALAIGIGFAVVLAYAPAIIDAIFTFSL